MLLSSRSIEGQSVSYAPTTYSPTYHHQHSHRSPYFSPQSHPTSLEITPNGSDIGQSSHHTNKRPASFDLFSDGYKRIKPECDATTPDSTPTSSHPDNVTPQVAQSTYDQRDNTNDNLPSLRLKRQIPFIFDDKSTTLSTTHLDLDTAPISNAIVQVRKALIAMGRALSVGEGASVETHLLGAMETLKRCYFGYFGSHTAQTSSTLESGEVTPELFSPISMMDEFRGIKPMTGSPDDPSLTSLISSSGIGPLRELVLLRRKQAVELEQKDLEIEAMRVENAGLNDQISRLEGELYKAKLENQPHRSSPKPNPHLEMAALISTNEKFRSKINSQATHIKGLAEKCVELRAAGKKDEAISTGRKEKAVNQPPISKLGDLASRQLTLGSVKVAVTPQTNPTLTIKTAKPLDPKSGSKSEKLPPPPGMGKKAKKKARAAERAAELEALALRKAEVTKGPVPVDLERQSKAIGLNGLKPEVVIQTRGSSSRVSQVSTSQKQVTTTSRSGAATNTNLTALTVRPILRWPNIPNLDNFHGGNEKVDTTACAQSARSSGSKRIPTGPKSLMDCGIRVRGRGQVQSTKNDDGSRKLRMDA